MLPRMSLPERVRATLGELGLSLASLLLSGTLVIFALRALAGPVGNEAVVGLLVGPAITAAGALLYRFAARHVDDLRPGDAGEPTPLERASLVRTLVLVVLGSVAAIVGSFLIGLLVDAFGVHVGEQEMIVEVVRTRDPLRIVALAVSAIALAPLAEEWLFRGLLFRRLLASAARPEAYFASAAAFAFVHDNPAGYPIYLWLGLVFAAMLHATGRFTAAVVVHVANNAFALTALLVT